MKIVIAFMFAIASIMANAAQPDLKSRLASDLALRGASNPGYRMMADPALCQTMKLVGLGCSYNERYSLIDFLQENGIVLFSCKDGTNPYTVGHCGEPGYQDAGNYIGRPVQNKMLSDAIKKNRALFKGGNLLASDTKKWK
jgi:hypothetical protein